MSISETGCCTYWANAATNIQLMQYEMPRSELIINLLTRFLDNIEAGAPAALPRYEPEELGSPTPLLLPLDLNDRLVEAAGKFNMSPTTFISSVIAQGVAAEIKIASRPSRVTGSTSENLTAG